jgi:hypothetical protein
MGLGKMITGNPALFNFIKAKNNPSEENNNALLASLPGAKKITEASPAAQAAQNNSVSRRRARKLQSASPLNSQTTLLGG